MNLDTARCSRLDLYIDWQGGWHPQFDGEDERCFIKRVHAEVDRKSCDGGVTGYVIGKGEVMARIYNKSLQTTKRHLEWYAEWLQQRNGSAFDPTRDVWRLEFQLTRAGVVGFKLRGMPEASDPDEEIDAELEGEDLPRISSVRKALHWAGPLWSYLTKWWLRLTVPTGDPNRGRWPEHLTWRELREGFAAVALRGAPLPDERLTLVRAKRHTGYRRLLDRMAVGVLTALEAMDTDPGAAAVSYLAYMHRLAGRIRRQQKLREKKWQWERAERARTGRPPAVEREQARGHGARVDSAARVAKVEQLLEMALGVFTSAGVVRLRLGREGDVSSVGDLVVYSLDEWEALAQAKGGIRQLLDEKWRRVYQAASPRGMFRMPRSA